MSVIETAKDIYDLVKKGATIELQERLMKLREEALALQEENLSFRTKLSELEAKLQLRDSLTFDGALYWTQNADKTKEGPFCQKCRDGKGLLVRLQNGRDRTSTDWVCIECHTTYGRSYPQSLSDDNDLFQ